MLTSLYNQQIGTWDRFSLSQNTLTVPDTTPYIGSDGRLLLQVTNPDNAPAPLVFGRPSLIFN